MTINKLVNSLDWTSAKGYHAYKNEEGWHSSKRDYPRYKLSRLFSDITRELIENRALCTENQAESIKASVTRIYENYSQKGSLIRWLFYRKRSAKTQARFEALKATLDSLKNPHLDGASIKIVKVDKVPKVCVTGISQEKFSAYFKEALKEKNLIDYLPYFPEIETVDLSSLPQIRGSDLVRLAEHFPRVKHMTYPGSTHVNKKELLSILNSSPLLEGLTVESEKYKKEMKFLVLPSLGSYTQAEIDSMITSRPSLKKIDLSQIEMRSFKLDLVLLPSDKFGELEIIPPKGLEEVTIHSNVKYTSNDCRDIERMREMFPFGNHIRKLNMSNPNSVFDALYRFLDSADKARFNELKYIDLGLFCHPFNYDINWYKSRVPSLALMRVNIATSTNLEQLYDGFKDVKPLQSAINALIHGKILMHRHLVTNLGVEEVHAYGYGAERSNFNYNFDDAVLKYYLKSLTKPNQSLSLYGCTNINDSIFYEEINKQTSNLPNIENLDLRGTSVSFSCYLALKTKFPAMKILYDPYCLGKREQFKNMQVELKKGTEDLDKPKQSRSQELALEYKRTGYISFKPEDMQSIQDLYHSAGDLLSHVELIPLKEMCVEILANNLSSNNVEEVYKFAVKNNLHYLRQEALIYNELFAEKSDEMRKAFLDDLCDKKFVHKSSYTLPKLTIDTPKYLESLQGLIEKDIETVGKWTMPIRVPQEKIVEAIKVLHDHSMNDLAVHYALQLQKHYWGTYNQIGDIVKNNEFLIPLLLQTYIKSENAIDFAKLCWHLFKNTNMSKTEFQKLLVILALKLKPVPEWVYEFSEKPEMIGKFLNLLNPKNNFELFDLTKLNVSTVAKILEIHTAKPKFLRMSLDLDFEELKRLAWELNVINAAKITFLDLSSSRHDYTDKDLRELLKLFPNLQSVRLPKVHGFNPTVVLESPSLIKLSYARNAGHYWWNGVIPERICMNTWWVNGHTIPDSNTVDWHHLLSKDKHLLSHIPDIQLNLYDQQLLDDKKMKRLVKSTKHDTLNAARCYKITNTGVADILKMGKIKHFNLEGCVQIGDEAFKNISDDALKNLESLNLKGTKVSRNMRKELSRRYIDLNERERELNIDYDKNFLESLALYEARSNCKVKLKTSAGAVYADKDQMLRINPAFSTDENGAAEMDVQGLSKETLQSIIKYAYTGYVPPLSKNAAQEIILYSGDLIDGPILALLKSAAEKKVISLFDKGSVKLWKDWAKENKSFAIERAAKKFEDEFGGSKRPDRIKVLDTVKINWAHVLQLNPYLVAEVDYHKLDLQGQAHLKDWMMHSLVRNSSAADLDVSECPAITSKGISHLLKMKRPLKGLNLYGCSQITDEAFLLGCSSIGDKDFKKKLKENKVLAGLTALNLRGTSISPQMACALIEVYPNLNVKYDELFQNHMANFQNKGLEGDIRIRIEGRYVKSNLNVHAHSAMLERIQGEKKIGVQKVKDLSLEAVNVLLEYAYTSYLPAMSMKVAKEIYTYEGDFISSQVKEILQTKLNHYFKTRMTKDNVIELYKFAKQANKEVLLGEARLFIEIFMHPDKPLVELKDRPETVAAVGDIIMDAEPNWTLLTKKSDDKDVHGLTGYAFKDETLQVDPIILRTIPYFAARERFYDLTQSDKQNEINLAEQVKAKNLDFVMTTLLKYIHREAITLDFEQDKMEDVCRAASMFGLHFFAARCYQQLNINNALSTITREALKRALA